LSDSGDLRGLKRGTLVAKPDTVNVLGEPLKIGGRLAGPTGVEGRRGCNQVQRGHGVHCYLVKVLGCIERNQSAGWENNNAYEVCCEDYH
jgi:hypothetical protein